MSRLHSRLRKLEPRKRADPIRDENLIDVTKLKTDSADRARAGELADQLYLLLF